MHVDHIRIQRSSNVSVIIMNHAAGGRPHCPRLLLAAQPLELRQVTVPVAEGRQGSSAVWHRHAHGHQDGARSGHGAWQNWVWGPASWVWRPQPPELDGWSFNKGTMLAFHALCVLFLLSILASVDIKQNIYLWALSIFSLSSHHHLFPSLSPPHSLSLLLSLSLSLSTSSLSHSLSPSRSSLSPSLFHPIAFFPSLALSPSFSLSLPPSSLLPFLSLSLQCACAFVRVCVIIIMNT